MGKKKKKKRAPVSETYAPAAGACAVWQPEGQEEMLTELLQPFPLQQTEEQDDPSQNDAVPTHSMPVPVAVPLYEEEIPLPKEPAVWWRWAFPFGALVLLAAGVCLAAKTDFGQKLWLFTMDKANDLQYNLCIIVNSILTPR